MDIQNPLWLLAIAPFLCLLFFLRRERKIIKGSKFIFRRPNLIDRLILRIRKPLWLASVLLVIYALASPTVKQESPPSFYTESRVMAVCIDTSTSMGDGPESAMEKIKRLSRDFALKRHRNGDYLSVTAYSGISGTPRGGAAIIMPPTRDWENIENSIGILKSRLLGSYTAIGEGVWVSLKALLKEQVFENKLDFEMMRQSLETVGTPEEDVSYLLKTAGKLGVQKNKVIVLFTDGYYNTGIDPAKPLWFAKRLGIRVHFVAFHASSATGLSQDEAEKRKALLAQSVVLTGGLYYESGNIEEVAYFYSLIDQAEKGKVLVRPEFVTQENYKQYVWLSFILFSVLIISEGRIKV